MACLVLCAIFAVGYVYFVSASVMHVVARKEANTEAARTQSAIAGLEERYFALQKNISPEGAERLGLAPVSKKHFVTRRSSHAHAAGTGNEI